MPGMSNKELVEKAVISAANTLASSGKLNPAQADRFLDYVFDESKLSKMARLVKFRNESYEIDKIGLGTRAAMPKSEAVDPGRRRGVTTSKVTLTPKEVMVPFEISDVFLEVNLEGKPVEDHIMQMFARQLNNDLEELYINGNTNGLLVTEDVINPGGSSTDYLEDSYLALFDGFLEQADSGATYDAAGASLSSTVFGGMLNEMPSKFKRDKSALKWSMSIELDQLWRERLASRATAMGDVALSSDGNLKVFGIEIVPLPLFDFYPPVAEDITFTGADSTVSLTYGPIQTGSVVIVPSTIDSVTPVTPFIEDTDYAVDSTAGTITHDSGGSIGNTDTVRVSYRAFPQIVLTHTWNWIIGIGRDIRLERDRDIFRGVDQYAMTVKVDCTFEETDAVVKAININNVA